MSRLAGRATQAGWQLIWRPMLAAAAAALLAACVGSLSGTCDAICVFADQTFYGATWLTASPSTVTVDAGVDASTKISAGRDEAVGSGSDFQRAFAGVSVVPPTPGITLEPTNEACDVPAGAVIATLECRTYRLVVSKEAIAAGNRMVTLSAVWLLGHGTTTSNERPVERVETFRVAVSAAPPTPDFQLAVNPVLGIYGTRATVPVSINRVGGFAEDVTIAFSGLTSGVVGSFAAEPVPTNRRNLELQIPARYAGGGRVDLRVTATTASGVTKTIDFSQYVEPLFKLILEPQTATLTAAAPLRIDLGVKAGDLFRTPSIGLVELSVSPSTPLPVGVTARFLDDTTPTVPVLPVQTVSRIVELVTDGRPGVMGPVRIRGTARGVPPDADGVSPFIEVTLDLTVQTGQFWQFVGNNLTHVSSNDADVIGMGVQRDNRPAFAWLQRPGASPGFVYMRRFDGTTFASSPPIVTEPFSVYAPGLRPPGGIDEAGFALTVNDAGQVAFTYDRGASLGLGRATPAAVEWSVGPQFVVGDPANAATPRARSPRVATGPFADAVVVSYIREANATTSGGELHVLSTFGNGVLGPLPGTLSGPLNANPSGTVLRNATALALRADGNPWVAWVEQPAAAGPARLWLRSFDGSAWGPAIEAPTPGTPVGGSVQLLVEPSGMVVVAWLEGNPAQLKLLRYDPSSQAWTRLDSTGNGRGSMNVTADTPALDVHLARHPDGRLLVTWTEGGADPRVWIKRQDADGGWRLVGTTVSQVERWAKTPRIVSDANSRLYVAWATYTAGQNPGTVRPYAEIDVAQWIFP